MSGTVKFAYRSQYRVLPVVILDAYDCQTTIAELARNEPFRRQNRFAGQDRVASWNPGGPRRDTGLRVFANRRMRIPENWPRRPLSAGCPTDGKTMTVPQLDARIYDEFRLAHSISWWDAVADCTLVVSQPSIDRDLWRDFLRGAQHSYRKHSVERVLDVAAIRDGGDTSMFWVTLDSAGRVIGGVRAKGPLTCAEDSHALVEWAGRSGLLAVRKMIADRLPFGVVEIKSAWVTDDLDRSRSLTSVLARAPLHSMAAFNSQFALATSASHVIARWISSGGVVASRIPSTPYPDDRYRTKMMWWDRKTFANYAEPKQASTALTEMMALNRQFDELSDVAAPQVSPV
jgi:hypothetical protein